MRVAMAAIVRQAGTVPRVIAMHRLRPQRGISIRRDAGGLDDRHHFLALDERVRQ
jgi:hypothetical protein